VLLSPDSLDPRSESPALVLISPNQTAIDSILELQRLRSVRDGGDDVFYYEVPYDRQSGGWKARIRETYSVRAWGSCCYHSSGSNHCVLTVLLRRVGRAEQDSVRRPDL